MKIEEGPTHIKEILAKRNIILEGFDQLTAQGFTQVPNAILRTNKVSHAAKFVYALLLSYAWHNDFCFPGQQQLAKDMGATDRSVRTYLKELKDQGFVEIKQRGQGRPNVYTLKARIRANKKSG